MAARERRTPRSGWVIGVGVILIAITGAAVFLREAPTFMQTVWLAGTFCVGLAAVAWGLLPGALGFQKFGVVAGGGIALFLILLFWLRDAQHNWGSDIGARPSAISAVRR